MTPTGSGRNRWENRITPLADLAMVEFAACLELMGYVDQAADMIRTAGEKSTDPTLTWEYGLAWFFKLRRRDFRAARTIAYRHLSRGGVPNFLAVMKIALGCAQCGEGNLSGVDVALEGLHQADAMGAFANRGEHASAIGEMMA